MSTVEAQQAHDFTPTVGYQTFAAREPVLRIKVGDTVTTESLWGDWYERSDGAWPGEAGPIYVEGAKPGDTLVVRIVELTINRDVAVSVHYPWLGTLVADRYTPMLTEPVPQKRYIWHIDRETKRARLKLSDSTLREIEIPLAPMIGRLATAPRGEESWSGLWPGTFGGNMDSPEATEGTTVYLAVFHNGGLFYFGDVHAAQGDGEICGTGLETTARMKFRFDLLPGKKISWPRFENSEFIMVAGSGRPLIDAFRIAHVDLIKWLMEDYGFEKWEAYQVVSQVGTARIGNAVDPHYTVMAKFPKKYLPSSMPAESELRQAVQDPRHIPTPLQDPQLIEAGAVPIGTIVAWHKNLVGQPLAAGWQECDGSEITEGPMMGKKTPELNAKVSNGDAGRFLRGGSVSGMIQEFQTGNHDHQSLNSRPFVVSDDQGDLKLERVNPTDSNTIRAMRQHRTGSNGAETLETRPSNMTVVWIMRVK